MSAKDPATTYQEFIKGIVKENPIFVQVLGMCPTLAVTNSAINGIAMGVATLAVLISSSFLVSLVRKVVPKQVRISVYIVIIATFVTVVDYALKASMPAVHKELGAFIPLIVVNCLILGRAEAFASKNTPGRAVADAAGMGLGFTLSLLVLSSVREIIGNGSWLGMSLFGANYEGWVVMILPPGGFIMLGVLLLVLNAVRERRRTAAPQPEPIDQRAA